MATKLRVIKKTDFTTKDGQAHTHYSCAYKGRILGVNTLRFDGANDLTVNGDEITINTDVEVSVRKEKQVDQLTGEVTERTFIDVLPRFDIGRSLLD